MKTKDYLDEYAGCYRAVDNCSDSIGGVEDCHICKEDKERMQEIEKELETSIRKEVYEDLCNNAKTSEGYEWGVADEERRALEEDVLKDLPIVLHKVEQIKQEATLTEQQRIIAIIDGMKQEEEIYIECPHAFDCGQCMNKTDKEAIIFNKALENLKSAILPSNK